jgi:hypothetical protein
MKTNFIAYGAGVGSTALLYQNFDAIKRGDIEVVYSDHQCDLPESRAYPDIISQVLDIDVTRLNPGNLYDYCYKRKILPSIHWRWCTDKFKIQPMRKYVDGDIPMIGLTLDEKRRAYDFAFKGKSEFPLINKNITRNQAFDMIEDQKPCKSGCYFCPFQKKEKWIELYHNHKDLFEKALKLEENALSRNPNIWLYKRKLRNLKREIETQTKLYNFI